MINALARLGGLDARRAAEEHAGHGHQPRPSGMMALFSTHPPIEERIAALQAS